MKAVALVVALLFCACAAPQPNMKASFFDRLAQLCGRSYAGTLVSQDPQDAAFAKQALVMHVRDCSGDEIRIPFSVGKDRSRTWIISRTATGLRLKHDHRHADGTPDVLTMYGGDSHALESNERVEFPVDQESIALFTRENRLESNKNTWALELLAGKQFNYELKRSGRFFKVAFDLSRPIDAR
jgi:hypothetical protein